MAPSAGAAKRILRLLNNDSRQDSRGPGGSRAYRHLAMELIFLCRFFVQAHEQSLNSSTLLREMLIAADDALKSAAEAGDKTSRKVDKKFRKAIKLLSSFEKDSLTKHPTSDPNIGAAVTRKANMNQNSNSPLTLPSMILHALENKLHAKPMGDEWPEPTRLVKFHLLTSLLDVHSVVLLALSNSPSIQEIMWIFSRFKDEKKRLTLTDNPHFYVNLPTVPEAYEDNIKIDPTEDFWHYNEFYVLSDKPEPVHIMTDRDYQMFGNFWCPKNAIIFKDICGRLKGEKIVKASLGGTRCGFCEQLPVSTSPRKSSNRRGLKPIITKGLPQIRLECSIGYLPMHDSIDIGLRVCAGRVAPDSLFLVPLPPPTSEKPGYIVAHRTYINVLDNDSLLQVFSCYRLKDKHNWNVRYMWRRLAHVCRRWRHLVFDSWSHLDLFLLLKCGFPSISTLRYLSSLPLFIDYSDETMTMAQQDEDNIHLGLQQHGRVRGIVVRAPSSSLRMWLEPMDNQYPRLEALSLLSTTTEEVSPVLPETLQAPDMRRLALHGIGLSKKLTLFSSAIALSTLYITHIAASCYFPPRDLVTQLQGLPHLEELSIGFATPIPLPSKARELLPAPIPPVTLPILRRLTFRGVGVYLDNLVAQINTPLLEQLNLILFFELTFILVNLTEFIHRTEGFERLVARVVFNKDAASINVDHYEQPGVVKLSLRVNCERLDWQIDSATQVCSALGKVLSAVEELTLDLDVDGIPPDWENALDDMLWHELLLPFIGVRKLHINSSLTLELSQALELATGELVLELLPELQELEVQLMIDQAQNVFAKFIATRQSVGRPVFLLNLLPDPPSYAYLYSPTTRSDTPHHPLL